jgi:DNA-binding NarL/FixJ family response regulator
MRGLEDGGAVTEPLPTGAARARDGRAGRTRVLIVEDHPVLRGAIRLACEASSALEVVGEETNGEAAVDACLSLEPDVLVVDPNLPGIDGLEVVRRLRAAGSRVKIVVLAARSDEQALFESIRAGVDGYLEKTTGVRTIADALARVAAGERLLTRDQERVAFEGLGRLARRTREASGLGTSVTPRELEILGYASYGLTMKQIANRLGLSPRTVETHLAKLYRKLGVRNRVQAVSRASALGLIDLT